MVVAPNINVIKRGVSIESVAKLDSRSSGISVVRNLNRSSALPIAIIAIIGTPQMVFTNLMRHIHVNMIANRPLMSLMAIGGYRSVDVTNLIRGYREPFVVTTPIFDHKYGHYVRPNRVTLKYPNFKKMLI
jgi:hypothetical protein